MNESADLNCLVRAETKHRQIKTNLKERSKKFVRRSMGEIRLLQRLETNKQRIDKTRSTQFILHFDQRSTLSNIVLLDKTARVDAIEESLEHRTNHQEMPKRRAGPIQTNVKRIDQSGVRINFDLLLFRFDLQTIDFPRVNFRQNVEQFFRRSIANGDGQMKLLLRRRRTLEENSRRAESAGSRIDNEPD